MSQTSPAAWHPDPLGRHQLRYWDGANWTEHVADSGVQSLDPLQPADGAVSLTGEHFTARTTCLACGDDELIAVRPPDDRVSGPNGQVIGTMRGRLCRTCGFIGWALER